MKKLLHTVLTAGMVLALSISTLGVSATALEVNASSEHTWVEITEAVEIPEITEAPEVTEAPKTTEAPEVTEAPETTEAPEVTEAPETAEAPEVTEAPETTEVPEVTEAPETTEVPEVTEAPETTEVPEVTEIPETPDMVEVPAVPVNPETAGTIEIVDSLVPTAELPVIIPVEKATITIRQILVYAGEEYVEYDVVEDILVGDTVNTEDFIREDARVSYTGGAEVIEVSGDVTVALYYEIL